MITLNSVHKKYGEKKILEDINLTINSGEITFIIGTSGAGKSTLLNLIGGLDKPTSGSVFFDGQNIQNDLDFYRAQNIGFVFQDFNLVQGLSVIQNIEIATSFSGKKKAIDSICDEINALGISDFNQKVETLSGGEKQRTAVIRSICKDANVIIADEPTGNLDSNNADLVLDLLQSLKTDKHVVIVSHDKEKARKYADRIITLHDGNIISDVKALKIQETTIKPKVNFPNIETTSSKSLFFNVFMVLGKNSVKLQKGKILSIALAISLAIASLAMVINLNQSGGEISHNINVNYLENDLINLYYENTPNAGYMEMPFSTDDIKWICDNFDIQENVEIFLNENSNWVFSISDKTSIVYLKQINIDNFFCERVMSNKIEGRFLENKNEIIIAEDVARNLFDGDCIGREVSLSDGRGNCVQLTIVGINHSTNPFDKIYNFVSAEVIKDILSNIIETSIFQRQEISTYYEEVQNIKGGGLYGPMKAVVSTEELLYGELPTSNEQVMISSELLSNVLNYFDINNRYTRDQIDGRNISLDDINRVFTKKLALNFNGIFPLYVSGIYLSNDIEMQFSDALIQEMKSVEPTNVDIYASNSDTVSTIKDTINSNAPFKASTQLENLKENVTMQTRFFSIALVLLGIILLFISVSLLSSFSKIAVHERKKEVAIIKSLGASNLSVLFILLFDSIVIALLSFFLSMFVFISLETMLPYFIPEINMFGFSFPFSLIAVINLLFAILVFVLTSLNLRKLVKKMPAELFTH